MGHTRKRNGSHDAYDIGNADVEKAHVYDSPSSASDYDSEDDYNSSPQSSNGYNSRDAMLPRHRRSHSRSYPQHSPVRSSRLATLHSYRIPHRTMRWLCIALMSTILIFILSLVRMSVLSAKHLEQAMGNRKPQPAAWESFGFLERYYGGIRTLQPIDQNEPEYPLEEGVLRANITKTPPTIHKELPASRKIEIKVDTSMKECFLDDAEQVRIPGLYGYSGVTQGFPEAVVGSSEAIGLENGMCLDRYGKLGPYGYGYSLKKGGIGAGLEGERQGSENVWKQGGQIDYRKIRWADAQRRCFEKNHYHFKPAAPTAKESFRTMTARRSDNSTQLHQPSDQPASQPIAQPEAEVQPTKKLPRTAVIIRTWRDYDYTPEHIVYLRSLVSELSLLSGGQYTVHFLIHVKDLGMPIWADDAVYNKTLKEALPAEFEGMGTLWSERQMGLIYGGLGETFYRDLPVHGVYRSAHLPLQWFAHNHPEYDFFWNWEMDVRFTGHWHQLFTSLSDFAEAQPRKGLWERNGRYYIPSVHGTWEDFVHMARVQSEMPAPQTNSKWASAGPPDAEAPPSDEPPVWGPLAPNDVTPMDTDPVPPTSYEKDKHKWGVGEPADLITLNPIFDPARTTWLLAEDVTGYNTTLSMPPRRASIITTSRLSRRLLETMHRETALHDRTMFSEMYPPTIALHHGLKAVYAPHPVLIDRDWPTAYLAKILNGGFNGASGGARTSVFGTPEHNLRGITWYYNSGFSGNLWKRWLGMRVDGNGGEEAEVSGEGRMCVPPVLIHPVKALELVVEGPRAAEGKEGGVVVEE